MCDLWSQVHAELLPRPVGPPVGVLYARLRADDASVVVTGVAEKLRDVNRGRVVVSLPSDATPPDDASTWLQDPATTSKGGRRCASLEFNLVRLLSLLRSRMGRPPPLSRVQLSSSDDGLLVSTRTESGKRLCRDVTLADIRPAQGRSDWCFTVSATTLWALWDVLVLRQVCPEWATMVVTAPPTENSTLHVWVRSVDDGFRCLIPAQGSVRTVKSVGRRGLTLLKRDDGRARTQ